MSEARQGGSSIPRVFTIAAGTPFLKTFVRAFLSGELFGQDAALSPETIAAARIFVPTRRAGIALTAALAEASSSTATLLPRILPLGDGEALSEDSLFDMADVDGVILPTAADFDRRLSLFRMVEAWRQAMADLRTSHGAREPFHVAATPADAFALAGDLGRLIDETIIEDVPLARLAEALPDPYDPAQHDQYWTLTQRFLQIAATAWPEMLTQAGKIDPADALKLRFRSLAAALTRSTPDGPVIIAGSTGSVTATADLMAAVARLPMGTVVLPGLDLVMDSTTWDLIGSEKADLPTRYAHPQSLLKRTLHRIGIAREAVGRIEGEGATSGREQLASAIFLPAAATARWQDTPADPAQFTGLRIVEAADEREEALAVALALRETLETPGQTAALVTPDRALARMVQGELRRWGIEATDSAGEPLATTSAGILARLSLEATAPDALSSDILALLRHRNVALMAGDSQTSAIDALEIAGMRGRISRGGVAGLAKAAAAACSAVPTHRAPAARCRISAEALAAAATLADLLGAALSPLNTCFAEDPPTLRQAVLAHAETLTRLCALRPVAAFSDHLALTALFDRMSAEVDEGPRLSLADYGGILTQLLAETPVPAHGATHPRLKIWGLLEARLLDADRIVLAGLDDGVWPPDAQGDPFLNRPMRIALGLQPPERRIGQTAHDFMMLLGGSDVILTRAAKRGGAPTVASRFLRRLQAYAGAETAKVLVNHGRPLLDWARALDAPALIAPVSRPEPRVSPDLMPKRLSLTEIETLYRDPYVVFARRVLGLDPLEPLDPAPDARDRGTVIHDAISAYVKATHKHVPADAEAALTDFGRKAFAEIAESDPESVAFWWRRFEAFVPWFVEWDRNRRMDIRRLHSEISGRHDLALPGGYSLRLDTRADRIEERIDGTLFITDYKTGAPPSPKEVLAGHAPQLTLTAALAARGAFADLAQSQPEKGVQLSYLAVGLAGGYGKEKAIVSKLQQLEDVIESQFSALQAHLGDYFAGTRGFLSQRLPKKVNYASEYDHLARHLEWSLGGESEEAEEET